MKKLLLACCLLSFISPSLAYSPSYEYWRTAYQKASKPKIQYSSHPRYWSTVTQKKTNTIKRSPQTQIQTASRYNIAPSWSQSRTQKPEGLIRALPQKTIDQISMAPIEVFEISLKYQKNWQSSDFAPAYRLNKLRLQIVDGHKLANSLDGLSVNAGGATAHFNRQGFVELSLNQDGQQRLIQGQSLALPVSIQVSNPQHWSSLPGSFRVRILELTAVAEGDYTEQKIVLSGASISPFVTFRPNVVDHDSGGKSIVYNLNQGSHTIGAARRQIVTSLRLSAAYDDLILESIAFRNRFGSGADSSLLNVSLWDVTNGHKKLAQGLMFGGQVNFKISNQDRLIIPRNQVRKLAVQIETKSQIQQSGQQLSLEIIPEKLIVGSASSGRQVATSFNDISVNAPTFTITQGAPDTTTGTPTNGFSGVKPDLFTIGQLAPVGNFYLSSGAGQRSSLGRASLQVSPNGLAFPGGLSVDDARLALVHNGRALNTDFFTTTSASDNRVVFDTIGELYFDPGETKEFALYLSLEDSGDHKDSDSIAVQILGDNSIGVNTLESLRAQNYNFIWSDHSGRPHTPTSADWLSGYGLPGIPSQIFVNKRDND